MKNKIILLIIAVCSIACGRNSHSAFNYNHKCVKDTLVMPEDIGPYFDSFVADCKKHNFKYEHAYCLQYIGFGRSNIIQGETDMYNGTIQINQFLADDRSGMKFVVYHELGHWFGLEHSDGIMSPSYSTSGDMQYVKNNWDELVDDYFKKLKN